jgi:cytoskeleton protein RodZ
VGERLRAAREDRGLTVEQAADRLRLTRTQINHMEADAFASLGAPVFARGFLRNYARLLELDAEALLAEISGQAPGMQTPVADPRREEDNVPLAGQASFWSNTWFLGAMLLLVVFIGVPVVLYFWLNAGEPEVVTADTQTLLVPQAVPSADTAPADTAPSVLPAPEAAEAAPTDVAATPAAEAEPAAPQAAPVATTGAEPAEPAKPPVPAAVATIRLKFAQPAWTEISDADGEVLLRALIPAGEEKVLDGKPPYKLVIGNARSVSLNYKGREIDLLPYIDVTVARLTLE